MSRGHPDSDSQRGCAIAGGHDLFAPANLAHQRKRRPVERSNGRRDPLVNVFLRWSVERMVRRFRSPAKFAQGRLGMRRKRCDLAFHILPGRYVSASPARPRPPPAAPRYGARTGIVVDGRLKGGPLRRPRSVPVQPSQPLDGQVRQEQRDNPSHRTPPRSMRRTRRCVDAPARPTNGRVPPRQP